MLGNMNEVVRNAKPLIAPIAGRQLAVGRHWAGRSVRGPTSSNERASVVPLVLGHKPFDRPAHPASTAWTTKSDGWNECADRARSPTSIAAPPTRGRISFFGHFRIAPVQAEFRSVLIRLNE